MKTIFRKLFRDRELLILLAVVVLVKLFSLNELWVERYYTYGFYPFISKAFRFWLGWIPFSVGDLLYATAFIYLAVKVWKLVRLLVRRQVKEYVSMVLVAKYTRMVLWVYLVFNILWGLNYNRVGIAGQLGLDVQPHSKADLYQLASILQERLCVYGDQVDSVRRMSLDSNAVLFDQGMATYKKAKELYPFLAYSFPSIKPSMYTPLGHYFGFTGYYNPFTAEAQVKTSVPLFIKPFVLCHEMAHQLGYAKENEANFVSFLVGRNSDNAEFRYSAYYDMYAYAINDLYKEDPKQAYLMMRTAHPQYRKDYYTFYNYIFKNRNAIEPFVSRFYDGYLKLNNQPKGKRTYNLVTLWLVAYMKKYGPQAL